MKRIKQIMPSKFLNGLPSLSWLWMLFCLITLFLFLIRKRIKKNIRKIKVDNFESALAYACYKLTSKEQNNTYLILRAQAKHETDNYNSELFRKAKNAFGMKYISGNIYQAGNYNGYARYNDYDDCIADLIAWLTSKGIYPEGLNLYIYVTALKAGGYYTDSLINYYIGCKRYYIL